VKESSEIQRKKKFMIGPLEILVMRRGMLQFYATQLGVPDNRANSFQTDTDQPATSSA
jgi:hypothetical protein